MRTVDPELWYRKIKKPSINVARPLKFGKPETLTIELCIREAFKDAMREFWNNCSMEGVKYIVDENSFVVSKLQWLFLTLLTVSLGVSAMWSNIYDMLSTPPVLFTPQSVQHPIDGVPFAAVALCSNNVISKKMLREYARYLYTNDKTGTYSVGSIERHLRSFGALLNMVYLPTDFQSQTLAQKLTQNISISDAMLKLSPPCKSTLKRCSWRGQLMACERLFTTRITSLGFCCVFNSRYQTEATEGLNIPAKLLDITGSGSGLSVMLEENISDYVYMRRPGFGTEVLIFDGDEYPLLQGVGVRTYSTWPNSTAYFSITARAQTPDPAIRYLKEKRRGCRIPPPSSPRSSSSWCLTDCQRSTVLALCNCVPYTLLPRPGQVVCGISHLYCLNKHRGKFLYYAPRTTSKEMAMSLLEESKDALHCPQCIPDCARVAYSAVVSYSRTVTLQRKLHRNMWFQNQDRTNTTSIHFFYSTEDQELYSIDAYYQWYEVIGFLSSQWVFLLGVTLINVFELLYYSTIRWMQHYLRRRKRMLLMKSLNSTF